MLVTLVDVISCENPACREFARTDLVAQRARSYYCQLCGKISLPRAVDASIAASPQRYEAFLRRELASAKQPARV